MTRLRHWFDPTVLHKEGHILPDAWAAAQANKASVGACRCGRMLWPAQPLSPPPDCLRALTWYPAQCDRGHRALRPGQRGRR